jgi:hypothetical protein
MNIAYIIHAYKNPEQLSRLISSLSDKGASFYIHIDSKVNIAPFVHCLDHATVKPVFVKRENSRWGSIGCVMGVLNAMQKIAISKKIPDYVFLLSGQDYPICSNEKIKNFVENNIDKIYLENFPLPFEGWAGNGGLDRITFYHFQHLKSRKLCNILNKFLKSTHFLLPERKQPYNLKPYGGSFYFGLPGSVISYLIDFIRFNPEYLQFHYYTFIPEEIFFHTILANAQHEFIKGHIVNKPITYVDWSKPSPPHPAVLTSDDIPKLKHVTCLFARKLDLSASEDIFDLLDNMRLR